MDKRNITKFSRISYFLVLGLGIALGKVGYKSFKLGWVTGVLLVGVLVGQIHF